jgi:hypothetical protein
MALHVSFLVSESNQDIAEIAERLLNVRVVSLMPARASGNNRVFCLETSDGTYALKSYGSALAEAGSRLAAEFAALTILRGAGGLPVPEPVARDDDACIGIYEWISGEPVGVVGSAEIDAAVFCVTRLHEISTTCVPITVAAAREACLSGREIVRQVRTRIERLAVVPDTSELSEFLEVNFVPLLEHAEQRARAGLGDAGFSADIPNARQVLSPSDFGLHNAIRRSDGSIVLIDFEYFGWDDPVRLTSDFLLHPGMNIACKERAIYSKNMRALFCSPGNDDYDFTSRLDLLYPLVGLRWCAIIMNEFLPERWERRVFAGEIRGRAEVLKEQFGKANRMLGRVRDALEGYEDGK